MLSHVQQKKTKRELTGKERQHIVSRLLFEMQCSGIDGKFLRRTLSVFTSKFHVTWRTISRIWTHAQEHFQNPGNCQFCSSHRKRRSVDNTRGNGTMLKFAKLLHLSPFLRRTIRDLANALIIPKSSLWDLKQDKDDPVIIACTSDLKPLLTQQHHSKLLHVTFCLTKIDPETHQYDDCFQSVRVDEKWFFISEKELHLYIAPGEVTPP